MSRRKHRKITSLVTVWYKGKKVLTPKDCELDVNMVPDCYVDGLVVKHFMEELIYRAESWSHDYMQAGVPLLPKRNPDTGELEKVYLTFEWISDVADGVWRYCGKCFKGEHEERYVCFE